MMTNRRTCIEELNLSWHP